MRSRSLSDEVPFNSLFPQSCGTAKLTLRSNEVPSYVPPKLFHAVLKISNISWDTSISDILQLIGFASVTSAQIHIPIDRLTGKTLSDLYVEMPDIEAVFTAIINHNRKVLKGRALLLTPSSFDELFRAHFSNVSGDISALEASSILSICQNYKVPPNY